MSSLSLTPYILHGTQVGFVCQEGNEKCRLLGGGTTTPFTHFSIEIPIEKPEMLTKFWLFILRLNQPPNWSKELSSWLKYRGYGSVCFHVDTVVKDWY
jgi:hypothetical protein